VQCIHSRARRVPACVDVHVCRVIPSRRAGAVSWRAVPLQCSGDAAIDTSAADSKCSSKCSSSSSSSSSKSSSGGHGQQLRRSPSRRAATAASAYAREQRSVRAAERGSTGICTPLLRCWRLGRPFLSLRCLPPRGGDDAGRPPRHCRAAHAPAVSARHAEEGVGGGEGCEQCCSAARSSVHPHF